MTTSTHTGALNPPNPARGKNRTKPAVAPHGIGQHTAATQHAFSLAIGGGGVKVSAGTGKKRKTRKASSGSTTKKRKTAKKGSTNYNSAAWMSKIRGMKGKAKKAAAAA